MNKINKQVLEFFSSLSDETRLKIILSIWKGPKTVTNIHKSFEKKLTLSAISHQLKLMEKQHIVYPIKKGREKEYHLSNQFCWCILEDAMKKWTQREPCPNCTEIKRSQ
ncbi:winged helix-turn-helix transcriptional regulator [Candidatus Woesearchaeota archaeon]|nr:winged helix-turn-helix transcriptional regulator [Candidatus Woesearchaeota archaeon]